MSIADQKRNFDILNSALEEIQKRIEETIDFQAIRSDIIKTQQTVKTAELHPNAMRKFMGWLTKLFIILNDKEKNYNLKCIDTITGDIASLEGNAAAKINMKRLREQFSMLKRWCETNQKIMATKPGARHTLTPAELDQVQQALEDMQGRLNTIQKARNDHFGQQTREVETDMAAMEVRIRELDDVGQAKTAFEELKDLQKKIWGLSNKKQEIYKERLSEMFEQAKEIQREARNARHELMSQGAFTKLDAILDEIDEALDREHIPGGELIDITKRLSAEVKNPMFEKGDDGRYRMFLIRQHRAHILDRIRQLKEQIDNKRDDNRAFVQECQNNTTNMEEYIAGIDNRFETLRDEYGSMNSRKGDTMRSLGEILTAVKTGHQQLKTGQFLSRDRQRFWDRLNELYSDVNNLLQCIAKPQYSEEWLKGMLQKNREMGDVMLRVVNSIPRPA